MIRRFSIVAVMALLFCLSSLCMSGCGSSSDGIAVGSQLYMSDGSEFGTVVAIEESHRFPDGTVEPGVQVDYGSRIPNTPSQWLPTRSAQRMMH